MTPRGRGKSTAIMPIYLYGSDVLKQKAKAVEEHDTSLIKLIHDMFETMHHACGIGLAATQVGDLRRVIVVDIAEAEQGKIDDELGDVSEDLHRTSPELPRTLALVNPEIISSEGTREMDEGCLSLPELRAAVVRPEKVKIRFRDGNFRLQEINADGLLARVIQHEMDHLDGILFVDRISKTRRSLLRGKLRKIKLGEIEPDYLAVTADES
jgi:peptide deformylase